MPSDEVVEEEEEVKEEVKELEETKLEVQDLDPEPAVSKSTTTTSASSHTSTSYFSLRSEPERASSTTSFPGSIKEPQPMFTMKPLQMDITGMVVLCDVTSVCTLNPKRPVNETWLNDVGESSCRVE